MSTKKHLANVIILGRGFFNGNLVWGFLWYKWNWVPIQRILQRSQFMLVCVPSPMWTYSKKPLILNFSLSELWKISLFFISYLVSDILLQWHKHIQTHRSQNYEILREIIKFVKIYNGQGNPDPERQSTYSLSCLDLSLGSLVFCA